jgi:hypothetical protein
MVIDTHSQWWTKEAQRLGTGTYVKKPFVLEKIGLAVKNELSL